MAKQNKPAIRFKEFTDAWEQRKLGEFFEKYQNTVYLQDEEEYRQISIRNTGVVEYRCTNKGKNIGRKRQYLIDTDTHPVTLTFTRQTVYEGGIGFVPKELNGAIVTENMPLLEMTNASQDFMKALFNTSGYYKSVINDDTLIGSAQKALHEKQWLDSYVCIPVLDEQKQIGSFFQQLEHLITLHQRKYDKLQVLKKAMLEKMFPKNGSGVPEIRFKGFTDAWEQRKLGEIATFINGRAYSQPELLSSGKYKVLRVGNFYTNDSWYYSDLELGEKYYADYGDLLYTWSATFGPHIWLGDRVIYHYHIWKINLSDQLEKQFAVQLLEQDRTNILSSKNGSTMVHITKEGMEQKDVIIPPSTKEQQEIGAFFLQLDNLITLHQRELEKLQNIKKSMLEKMFV